MTNQNAVTREECEALAGEGYKRKSIDSVTGWLYEALDKQERLARAHLELLSEVEELRRKLADAEANQAILG